MESKVHRNTLSLRHVHRFPLVSPLVVTAIIVVAVASSSTNWATAFISKIAIAFTTTSILTAAVSAFPSVIAVTDAVLLIIAHSIIFIVATAITTEVAAVIIAAIAVTIGLTY